MKPSKKAMVHYILGLIVMIIGFGESFLGQYYGIDEDRSFMSEIIGLIGLCLLWVVGIQTDLYGRTEHV